MLRTNSLSDLINKENVNRSADTLLRRRNEQRLIIDVDSTEDPVHGKQESAAFYSPEPATWRDGDNLSNCWKRFVGKSLKPVLRAFNLSILLIKLYAIEGLGVHERLFKQRFDPDIPFGCGTQKSTHYSGYCGHPIYWGHRVATACFVITALCCKRRRRYPGAEAARKNAESSCQLGGGCFCTKIEGVIG
jgi:hypothetical protein